MPDQEETNSADVPTMEVEEEAPAAASANKENDNDDATAEAAASKSALRDNIDRKGKNAYYYAHSKTASGPQWDGKPQPKLLGRQPSDLAGGGGGGSSSGTAGFHLHKSTITSYAFSDEGGRVRLYVSLPDVAERCPNEEDVTLEHTVSSLCLVVRNYPSDGEERCLSFGKLQGEIEGATFRKKKDRIVLTLTKMKKKRKNQEGDGEEEEEEPEEWTGVAAKGDLSERGVMA
uniref:CS domain-containing protein n=1 Tax=Pseudictyota dubia TaxID=2749911 RepID=A0A6U2DY62_9STRA|mmetsp:Transcript_31001/g.57299  ORF Transcript_31001/g.57299 Transcript_31001/m.57299 type:complete len:232 (+) Transcript_31001:21-716(+)|eukprot:CAMPEP_0197434126 /NCGR_PEP_ID=MMETSP1175-20131217/1893_1 /TAXON_ID=1003142 /ORGANISM="Triceratium dubium, Strain CCMP147" /LENGTH=231 /DNA_ID=CAMNT_0042962729 /DNA_START=32 /DNA_END=727 /DNA_ORIENTATION=-